MKLNIFKLALMTATVATAQTSLADDAFLITSLPSVSSQMTTLQPKKQIIENAKEDAAAFIASGGVIKGANLVKAIEHIKSNSPQDESSDTTIATRILND